MLEKRGQKRKVLGVMISALVIVCITTVSYSFFKIVADNTNPEKVALTTGTMELEFADNDNGVVGGELSFGESVTKKFTLKNTGTVAASASLDWQNLINTYQNRSLSYRLLVSTTEDGPTTEVVPETNMPVTSIPIRQTLCSEISVPVGTTYYYQLIITLNYLDDVEQSVDIGAQFNTEFIVDQPVKYRYYRLTVNTNGGAFSDNTIAKEHLLKHQNTVELEEPTRTGYTFSGWRVQGTDSKVEGTAFTMGISDTYLYAEWTPEEYTLSINRNDGGSIENKTVKYNTPVAIETPTREGYTFTGWEVTGGTFNSSNEFTLTTPGNASINATWEINNYKYIVYHNQQDVDGNGYTMVGADTDEGTAAYNTVVTPDTKTYTGFTSPEKKDLTIKAEDKYPPELNKVDYNYSRNKYKLTIDPNGGTYNGSTSPIVEEMYYGASKILSTSTPSAESTLVALGKTVKEGNPTFTEIGTTNETSDGLYAMADDYGTSYYYRGAVEDNYVKFAGFYWRIIRVNGDGSLRMIYDGTVAHKNGEGNSTFTTTGVDGNTSWTDRFINNGAGKPFNPSYDDNAYVGWMYGTVGADNYRDTHANINNSIIKDVVNAWYEQNLLDYDEYIADSVYCNDRNIPGGRISNRVWDTELGYSKNYTAYGQLGRFEGALMEKSIPQFMCLQKNDAFTVADDIYGNAIGSDKSYKVGLITADEVVAAGSPYRGVNRNYYLYKSSSIGYWTMTPDSYFIDGHAYIADVRNDGHMHNSSSNTNLAVAPVISLKSEYALQLVGEGTAYNPFEISVNMIPARPEITGYNFTGWTKTSGKGTIDGSTYTMGDGDTTLVANYAIKQQTITFNANGGTVDESSRIINYGETYGELPIPTHPNSMYTFNGWYTASDGGDKVDENSVVYIDQVLYAHWAEKNTLLAVSSNNTDKMWRQKENIKKVIFENVMSEPTTYKYSYDISKDSDSSVMAYLVEDGTTGKYIAHIQADGKIFANSNSTYLFSGFTSLESIEGLEYFDTSFVWSMSHMFNGCKSLKNLDLSSFDTSNVTGMYYMFYNCSALKTLNLSGFNTSNVTNMTSMFVYCSALTTLDLSSFDTSRLTNTSDMFVGCNNLINLDLSSFDTSNITDFHSMFRGCNKLTTTITIRGTKCSSYYGMFNSAASISGQITVNYTSDASSLVDAMIATKSDNSNVVKGLQVS